MNKHTPGPWKLRQTFNDDDCSHEIDGIALVFRSEQANANARLIAAAPELLEALKLVVAYDEGNHIDGLEMMLAYSKALDAVRAAIAKAEGETA